MRLSCALLTFSLLCAAAASAFAGDAAPSAGDAERFFEAQVRPMLVARCLACHGPEKQEAGLRLDSRASLLKGSDSEPVVVLGDPDKSPLIHAVRYDGDVQMPPAGKLGDDELALLTTWVKMGVPWGGAAVAAEDMAARAVRAKATHWAYQPIVRPELSTVSDPAWAANPVDRFILAELDKQGLRPSPAANRGALLRRATFDLVGLPATAAEIEAFVNDPAPDAFARAVDRLLASPGYGQRWGRHWLDVARYADTKGYVFAQDRRFPYSYTYRDYVIRALNEDRPYDEFVRQQLAADLLDLADRRDLAAMGFLTVGRRFSNNNHDIIDDRIDVATRGLMGLTVTCARCHDHKYDPVPTDDYYSLYGMFASSVEPNEGPLIGDPQEGEAYAQFKQELGKRERAVEEYRETKHRELLAELRGSVKDYLCQVVIDKSKVVLPADAEVLFNKGELRPTIVRRWREFIDRTGRNHDPVFALWHELSAVDGNAFADGAAKIVARLREGNEEAEKPLNRLVREAIVSSPPASMLDVAGVYGELLTNAEKSWQALLQESSVVPAGGEAPTSLSENRSGKGDSPILLGVPHKIGTVPDGSPMGSKPPARLPDDAAEQLRQVLYVHGSPTAVPQDEFPKLSERAVREELRKLTAAVDELKASSPAAPPHAMVLNDEATPHDANVLLRGDPNRPDRVAPRRFVQFLAAEPGKAITKGSGRLELAQEITRADNPLTARVLVNRVWMHHFGTPLVRTPGDFGLRSDPPTHPQLLDFLARQFIDEGWSLKRLHRLIMLSNTYQQASEDRPEGRQFDPENRLLWRANRRRLDFEAMRDAMLAAAGRLDTNLEGRAVDIWSLPYSTRRTVYAFVDRQDLPGVFRMFDFASPDISTPQRPQTVVPQQALFSMNAPFVLEQARHLAARSEVSNAADATAKVKALYRVALGRDAEAGEVALGVEFIEQAARSVAASEAGAAKPKKSTAPLAPWEQLAQALLLTNEFMFID